MKPGKLSRRFIDMWGRIARILVLLICLAPPALWWTRRSPVAPWAELYVTPGAIQTE
jgi:hypothetical protein